VVTFEPNQTGANYTAQLTVGLVTVEGLIAMQGEPFDAFDVHVGTMFCGVCADAL
jgi:hypothetical protein